MADFAQLLYGTAQQTNQDLGKGVPEAAAKGAELALKVEQMAQARQELEQKKQEVQSQKFNKLYEYIKDSRNFKTPAARNNYLKSAIGYRNALGITPDEINDDLIKSMGFDENQGRMAALDLEVRGGRMSTQEALSIAQDPQKFATIVPLPLEGSYEADLSDAQKEFMDRQSAERQAALRANQGEARGKQIQDRFDQSQKTKLADKINSLGVPSLKGAIEELDKNLPQGLEGWKPGMTIPGVSGADGAIPLNRLKGKANKVRGAALSIGNQVIKLRTGAAMNEAEAGRILSELGFVPTIGEGGTWTGLTFKGIVSEESFVNGMKRAKKAVDAVEQTYRRAYGQELYDSISPPLKVASPIDLKAKAREYLEKYPNGPGADKARSVLGE